MQSVEEPGEGYFYTRQKYLLESIKALSLSDFRRPRSLIGKEFFLNKKLRTVLAPPLPTVEIPQ